MKKLFGSSHDSECLYSALACSRMLILLSGGTPSDVVLDNSQAKIRKAINEYGKENGVDLTLGQLKLSQLTPDKLPLAYKNKQGEFVIAARISGREVLVQETESASPKILSLTELEEQWCGEVIRMQGPSLRFDVSWFIPEFVRHRRLFTEVLLFSLMLQLLALATPLFFQVVMDKVLVHQAFVDPRCARGGVGCRWDI